MRNALALEADVNKILKKSAIHSVLVAVSGGADSMALLRLCHKFAASSDFTLEAVNCNFHLRGDESDRDSIFVAKVCRELGVKLHSLSYDVEDYIALHPGLSIEMACRELRYADFYRIAEECHLDRIAVAHNADDDVETMLLNMLRGSGCRGLKGMDFDNGKIIRPLLATTRSEIEEYLSEIGQSYVTDSSNLTSDYRRNFIRRDVIPLLESRWPAAKKALGRTVKIMKEDEKIVRNYYDSQLRRLVSGNASLDVYAPDVTAGTIFRFLENFGGNAEMAEEIMEAVGKPYAQRTWLLSDSCKAILERDRLRIIDCGNIEIDIHLDWTQLEMSPDSMDMIKSSKDHSTAYLPNGPEAYELRKPEAGDRMSPLGMKGTRLVSDIVSDAKLDRIAKTNLKVLVRKSDGEIIWIPGLKRSRFDLITPKAKTFYKIKIS